MNRSMKHGSQALASMNLDRSADKLVKHSNNALDRKERCSITETYQLLLSLPTCAVHTQCECKTVELNNLVVQGVKQKIILLHIARVCPHTQWI